MRACIESGRVRFSPRSGVEEDSANQSAARPHSFMLDTNAVGVCARGGGGRGAYVRERDREFVCVCVCARVRMVGIISELAIACVG